MRTWDTSIREKFIQQIVFEKLFTHQARETKVVFYASNKIQLQNIVDLTTRSETIKTQEGNIKEYCP